MSPKLKVPGAFFLSCVIGNTYVGKALCDLGASINVMPLSIFDRLGIKGVKDMIMRLQLAARSNMLPHGLIEDVLVKVDKFIFPAEFVICDINKDEEVPIILGRSFLAT